jgi:hypothetical protein
MRIWLLALVLSGCATNSSPTATELGRQIRAVTHQGHPSFQSPADATMLSPTPDSGGAISTDATKDCGSCLPR